MFSKMQLLTDNEAIALRFNSNLIKPTVPFLPKHEISGFDHSPHPIIIKEDHQLICDYFRWGLVPPDWRKGPSAIWNHTISAKLEYLHKRYAWQKVSQNRCLIPVTAYFEYRWNDPKGTSKTKYIINHATEDLFALAGLYSFFRDPHGNSLSTFAVCTTEANEIMKFVHNKDAAKNYHRMPVMLNRNDEESWLDISIPYTDFAFPNYQPNLAAMPLGAHPETQTTLF